MSIRNEVTRVGGDEVCIPEEEMLQAFKDGKTAEDMTALAGREMMWLKYSPILDALELLWIERSRITDFIPKQLSPCTIVHGWER
jgi:hypothetical protein